MSEETRRNLSCIKNDIKDIESKLEALCVEACETVTQCVFPKERKPLNAPGVTRGTIWQAWNGQAGTVQGDNTGRDDQFCDFSATLCDGAVIESVTFKGRAESNDPSQPDFFVQFFDNGTLTPVTFITNDGMQNGPNAGQIQQSGAAQNYAEFEVQLTGITTISQLSTLCVGFGFDGDVSTNVSGFEMLVTVSGCLPATLQELACSNIGGQLKDALRRDRDNQTLFITEDGDIGITGGNVVGLSQNTDSQVISLAGNTLTLSGGIVPDSSVDLSPYLDNTDDQTITNFAVVGSNVVLSIEGGNTVTIPLADFQDGTGTDDQTISLIGNVLSIEDGNSVNLSAYLDNTDSQVLTAFGGAATGTTSIAISGGNSVPIIHPPVNLNVTSELILHERYRGRSATGTTVQHAVNSTMTRTAVGRWQVRFTGGTHPNGESYTPSVTAEEQSANRDTPDITIVQGTQNASGFDIQITTGDNGGAADGYVDTPWSWGVESPITVVTGVSVV